jgi:hypothetical protein
VYHQADSGYVQNNYETRECHHTIRLFNTGGAGTPLDTIHSRVAVDDVVVTTIQVNDLYGTADSVDGLIFYTDLPTDEQAPIYVEPHSSQDVNITFSVDIDMNEHEFVGTYGIPLDDSIDREQLEEVSVNYILHFPDQEPIETEYAFCTYVRKR